MYHQSAFVVNVMVGCHERSSHQGMSKESVELGVLLHAVRSDVEHRFAQAAVPPVAIPIKGLGFKG